MKKKILLIVIYLILSELLQAYLIAGAGNGVYSANMINCGYAGCSLAFLYRMPFHLVNIIAYLFYGKSAILLNTKQLFIWLIPFWIFYATIVGVMNLFSNLTGLRFILDLTVNVHGCELLVLDWFWDIVFTIIGFFGAFLVLKKLNEQLTKPKKK